jgi:divalent metal cation (Fe/Co/Zn/Cd) transporter
MSHHKKADLLMFGTAAVIFGFMIFYGSWPWVYLIGVIGCAAMLCKVIWRDA